MNKILRLGLAALALMAGFIAVPAGQELQRARADRAPATTQAVADSSAYALGWVAVGEVSGGASASSSYRLNATVGQMGAMTAGASTTYRACTGFQCVRSLFASFFPNTRQTAGGGW